MKSFLESKGYKLSHTKPSDYPFSYVNHYYRTVDRLTIVVEEYTYEMSFLHQHDDKKYEVKTVASEKKGVWYKLHAYAFTTEELQNRLEEVENNLIKMFNAI